MELCASSSYLLRVVCLVNFLLLSSTSAAPLLSGRFLGLNNQGADLNDHGEVAGEHLEFAQKAQFFSEGRWIGSDSTIGSEWSAFYGLNDLHAVVGTIALITSNGLAVHAVRVHAKDPHRAINLGSLTGENGNAKALAINDSGTAVGDSLNAAGRRHAVRFETNGVVSDLGVLGGISSSAIDINKHGEIVGEWRNPNSDARGFRFPTDGVMQDIGTLGGSETHVKRINAHGEIVGSSMTKSGELHAFVYSNGEMKDLGTLGGNESVAYGINDHGVIVGASTTTNGSLTAFIKHPGQPMENLAPLAKVLDGDSIVLALAINNHGVILARGFKNASNYLLEPAALEIEINNGNVLLKYLLPENTRVRIDASTSLPDWAPLLTNTVTTTPLLLNQPVTGGARFYRAIVQ